MSTERVDTCIVGSGFGGSILAYYLAAAGQRVLVLERGPRRATEDLQLDVDPDDLLDITGYFLGDGVAVLAASAVGGGSLVYSGASLRAPGFVFERREQGRRVWPEGITRTSLDPYYERAEAGLGVHQLGFDEVAKRGGVWGRRMNDLGYAVDPIRQATTGCTHCGFCNTGCRFFAKNHLTLNYLHQAEQAGAEVRPDTEALQVRPRARGGYRVLFGPRDDSSLTSPQAPALSQADEVVADRVVMGAGTLGTAGLLMRSRAFLPGLSPQLGQNFSGNGDLSLGAILPTDPSLPGEGRSEQHQGVAMDTVCYEFLESHGFIIITQHLLSVAALLNGDGRSDRWWGLEKKRVMQHYGDTMVGLAVIGVDGSPGTVVGLPDDRVDVSPALGVSAITYHQDDETRKLYADARRIVRDLVERMGGTFLDLGFNIAATAGETAYTAHPVGTARLSDSPATGVADPSGQVHGHPGLYVADGAAVPSALGVNPSLTIAALAERTAARLLAEAGLPQAPPPTANPFASAR